MNFKIAIIYASVTGNTKSLVDLLASCFRTYSVSLQIYTAWEFTVERLADFDAVIIATYTWGSGSIPKEMHKIFKSFERQDVKNLITGVVGTGDSFYHNFCGAVDAFRDMLFVHSTLAATLKIELSPQSKDCSRCIKFAESIIGRLQLEVI